MKIHHMNCGTMCPICKRLINGSGGFLKGLKWFVIAWWLKAKKA